MDERSLAFGLAQGVSPEYALDKRYIRKDGSPVWVRVTVSPIQEAGKPSYYLAIVEDITERIQAQEQERFLRAELQHRVRNTLTVVRSIVQQTAEASQSVDDFAMHLDGRLAAFARAQAYVIRHPGKGVDLTYVIAEQLSAYHAREGEQVHLSGPALSLDPDAAEKISLAIHELATNAVKHGALTAPGGRIDIGWRIEEADQATLVFEWNEHVPSGGILKPRHRGFGTELLEDTLVYDLDADVELDFTPMGLKCRVKAPLNAVAWTGDVVSQPSSIRTGRPGAAGRHGGQGSATSN